MKICRCCSKEKTKDLFVKNHVFKDGIDTICLECSRNKVKIWRKENPEKRKIQQQKESKKDYAHNKHLKHNFNITRKEYLEMFTAQEGNCAICNKNQLDFTKRLSVDHCHTTGKIRQLLCSSCNSVLGFAKEDSTILQNAINYIEKHNGKQ
jgi:hypothetical protein